MNREAFFTVHRELPREGPGEAADVHWVLDQIPKPARVLDAACGPGADTVTLADALPEAAITAIDKMPHFVAETRTRVPDRVTVREGDAFDVRGPFDIIWCAGAVYFKGVTQALKAWRPALGPNGRVAFSEPLQPGPDAPQAAWDFWAAEYPQSMDRAGLSDQGIAAGFETLGTRLICGRPWEDYYTPMQARIDKLRGTDPALTDTLHEHQREIDLWRAARDHVAYLLILTRPA